MLQPNGPGISAAVFWGGEDITLPSRKITHQFIVRFNLSGLVRHARGARYSEVAVNLKGAQWPSVSVIVQVVLAARPTSWASVVRVDHARGLLVGQQGLPFVPFGAYQYTVTLDGDRAFPTVEAPHGLNLVAPYISV